MSVKGENDMELAEALSDSERVTFYKGYIAEAAEAVYVDKVRHLLVTTLLAGGSMHAGCLARCLRRPAVLLRRSP
jgi:hypothetical protein